MNTRRWLAVLAVVVGAVAVWAAAGRYAALTDSIPAEGVDAALRDAPAGDKLSLRFFKNPAALAAVTMNI